MKKAYFVTTFLLISLILNLATVWAQDIGPRMVLEEKTFDAKEIKEGEFVEHSFPVRNTGDRPLEITKVQPG